MTAQELLADTTERAAVYMVDSVRRMPDDKRTWSPALDGNTGRSAMRMMGECIVLNENWTETLAKGNAEHVPPPSEYWDREKMYETQPLDEVASALHESTAKLAAAIRALPDDALNAPMRSPWMPDAPQMQFAAFAYENIVYHIGQINYIQLLYGDADM